MNFFLAGLSPAVSGRRLIPCRWKQPRYSDAGRRPEDSDVQYAPAARNFERPSKPLHASVRRALRQAWELDDADKAERLLRNLARRLDHRAPSVSANILEGLDEMLTFNRLGLPLKLRRSLACTNAIENMMGTARRVCRNVKRWRNAAMALRWAAAGMMETANGFRRLKSYKQLSILKAPLAARQSKSAQAMQCLQTTQ